MSEESFSSLSPELWQHILEHADQATRARASSVSKSMQAAAVAAMTAVDIKDCGMQKLDSLQLWLPNYGQHVTRFEGAGPHGGDDDVVLAELPCPWLQELKLAFGMQVLLGPSTLGPGVLQGCPGLTSLHLSNCSVLDDGLEGISALTGLKELELRCLKHDEQTPYLRFPGSVLQHCSRLTYLYLCIAADDWQYISGLDDLQELHLETLSHITRSTLPAGLPTSLRALQCSIDVLDPALLAPLTNMRRLDVSRRGRHPFRLEGGATGDALLRAIAPLQQLEDLSLCGLKCKWPPMSSDHPTLTASSSLTKLQLLECSLPAWEHVFPPGRMLQSVDIHGDYPLTQLQAAVKQLVACCPKLQDLKLHIGLGPTVDVAVLGQLSALTALHAGYRSISDVGGACQVLQQVGSLTRLVDLNLFFFNCEALEVSALLPLTALRQLTHLKCTRRFLPTEAKLTSDLQGGTNQLVSVLSKQPSLVAPEGTDLGPSLPGWQPPPLGLILHSIGCPNASVTGGHTPTGVVHLVPHDVRRAWPTALTSLA